VNSAAYNDPALANRLERCRHQIACGRKDDGCVEQNWSVLFRRAGPYRAQLQRKLLRCMVAAARERIDVAPLPDADLGQDMRGGAEAEETDALAIAGLLERTPANQSGAQKWRERYRIGVRIEIERKGCVGHDMRRETAVAGVAGELRPVT